MPMLRLKSGRAAWAALGLGAMLLPAVLWAQSDESDRRRAVGDWLVEDVAEDMGRAVHLRRDEGDYSIDYHLWLDPGMSRLGAQGFLIGRLNCARGGEESIDSDAIDAAATRRRIEEYLAGCEAPPEEVAALLQDYDRAFQLARLWAQERLPEMANADVQAEAAADNAMMAAGNLAEMDMGSAYENAAADGIGTVINTEADPQ